MVTATKKVQRVVRGGAYDGATVRTARKAGRCEHMTAAGRCINDLSLGSDYVFGRASVGSFDRYRHCAAHVTDSGGAIVEVE